MKILVQNFHFADFGQSETAASILKLHFSILYATYSFNPLVVIFYKALEFEIVQPIGLSDILFLFDEI